MTCDTSLCRACTGRFLGSVPEGPRRTCSCLQCYHTDFLDASGTDNKATHASRLEPLAECNNSTLQCHLCENTHSNMQLNRIESAWC